MSDYVNMISEPVLVWRNSEPVVDVTLTFHHVACCTVGVMCEVVPSWYSPIVSSYLTARYRGKGQPVSCARRMSEFLDQKFMNYVELCHCLKQVPLQNN